MEEGKITFTPVPTMENGVYVVKDYDLHLANIQKKCAENCHVSMIINNYEDYKTIKDTRTELNASLEEIKSARKNITELLTGTLEAQLKTIEKLLDQTSKSLTEKINDYDKNVLQKPERQKLINITIKSYDQKVIDKIKAYALKQGAQVVVK